MGIVLTCWIVALALLALPFVAKGAARAFGFAVCFCWVLAYVLFTRWRF